MSQEHTLNLPVSPRKSSVPVLVDFLNTVPAPLTGVLICLAPVISRTRHLLEVVSWKASWYDSWLALAAWWAVCLLSGPLFRYLLPIAILFMLALSRWTTSSRSIPLPVTEHTLQGTITDLSTIHVLLPTWPTAPPLPSIPSILRLSTVVYVPYLILTHALSLPTLLGLSGTILLTIRAPWAQSIHRALWSSAYFRWTIYKVYSLISGTPLSPPTPSLQPTSTTPTPINSTLFLFTIYENQRWWMGLDWTAALLPAERPSWCSAAQHPVSPPNVFALPSETTFVTKDRKGGSLKRTAKWGWEDGEWKVVVKKESGGLSRIEKPLPKEKDESGSRLRKAAGKIRDRSMSTLAGGVTSEDGKDGSLDDSSFGEKEDETNIEPFTDADGWVYGDNKWAGLSGKGGIGKYTRYRRWTRIAVLFETVEVIPSASTPPPSADPPMAPPPSRKSTDPAIPPSRKATDGTPPPSRKSTASSSVFGIIRGDSVSTNNDRSPQQSPVSASVSELDVFGDVGGSAGGRDEREGIRQRLKSVVNPSTEGVAS